MPQARERLTWVRNPDETSMVSKEKIDQCDTCRVWMCLIIVATLVQGRAFKVYFLDELRRA